MAHLVAKGVLNSSIEPATESRVPKTSKPRHRRAFTRLCLIKDVEKPYDYGKKIKWAITSVVAVAAAAAPMGAAVFYPALPSMSDDFGVSETVVNLSVALYMLAMAIFPLWWSSLSETLGRRTVYLVSFLFNVIFALLCGFSTGIGMLIAFRILAGGAAASVQAVGAGTIADIWQPSERGRAMGIFYLGPLLGPLLVPIIVGALSDLFGWRSAMWFLAAFGAAVFLLILVALPETLIRQPELDLVLSPDSNSNLGPKRCSEWFETFFIEPLQVVLYLRFPAVLIVIYYAAITFGSLYVLNISIQSVFSQPPYGFSSLIIGLLYVPSSLGYLMASLLGGPWIDRIMVRAALKAGRRDDEGNLVYLPEDRMRENAWISASVYPAALIWYGWAVQRGVHWAVPGVAMFFYGAGSMLVFSAATTMLTEFMPHRSSSGVALNNLVRNIFGCVATIITQPLINAMGHGWMMTLIGLVVWVSGNLCIWLLRSKAQKWRTSMDAKLSRT